MTAKSQEFLPALLLPERFTGLREGLRTANPNVAQRTIVKRLQYPAFPPPHDGGVKPGDQAAARDASKHGLRKRRKIEENTGRHRNTPVPFA
jgi:hypothetical protein